MSMLALSESECQEILAFFRQHLPHVPDAWLQVLAANYGLDAVVDIDPNDVVAILSVPGELHRIQISLAKHKLPEEVHQRMRDELATRGIERKQITANLLMIQDSSAKLADIGQIVKPLLGSDYENALENGWCWQNPSSSLAEQNLEWLLVVRP